MKLALFLLISGFGIRSNAETVAGHTLTWGIELTAVTDGNDEKDIGLPINGKVVNFVDLATKKFAQLTNGTIVVPTDGTILARYQGIIEVKNSAGTWMFHNDHGSLEVASPVLTDETAEMEAQIFQTFRAVGLTPNVYSAGQLGGGGHMHVGRDVFDRNPKLLRNLMVDLENRPYIQSIFEELGDSQAKSIRDMGAEDEFVRRLSSVDANLLAGTAVTIEDVSDAFIKATSPAWKVMLAKILPPFLRAIIFRNIEGRASAVNIVNLYTNRPPTVEFRFPRPPNDMNQLRQRMLFFERYLDWLSVKKNLIPFQEISTAELRRMESPTRAIQEWNAFLKNDLHLDPANYVSEIEDRFPLLGHSSVKLDGGYEFEIRSMHSPSRAQYEIKVISKVEPDIEVAFNGITRNPHFIEVEPGVWTGIISNKEEIIGLSVTAHDSSGKLNRNITGSYDLWDQHLSERNEGVFTPRYKLPVNCNLLMKGT